MLTAGGQTGAAQWLAANPTANVGAWGALPPLTTDGTYSGPTSGIDAWARSQGVIPPSGAFGGPVANQSGGTLPLVPGGLNVPYGSDYFAPSLDSWTRLALGRLQQETAQGTLGLGYGQLGENARQFNTNALMTAAQALARLYAQGPQSAAELAFMNAGAGFPAIGGNAAAIASLIRSSTLGGSNPDATLNFGGGQSVSIPSTLGGQALARLQADPNLAGVIASFAKAVGNPDILSRSAQALIPAGFGGPRYGTQVLPGMGL